MSVAQNPFKRALREGSVQIGFWLALADPYAAEICATAEFDWLLIDGEHAPNDLRSILGQLQAVAPYPAHAVVRPVSGDTALIKHLLDIGATSLLVPMVETAEEARRIVAATRYPPGGIRGVGSALARASRWNTTAEYLDSADAQICVLVQIESEAGLHAIDDIAAVPGVDGLFIGPSDLAASLGYRGEPGHAQVVAAIEVAIARILRSGKAAGLLTPDETLARRYIELGATFVAVGSDVALLARNAGALARTFKA